MATKKRRSPVDIDNLLFNDAGLAHKEINVGFSPKSFATVPDAEIYVGKHMPVKIINESGGTIFVVIGATGLAAPVGYSQGIAILNNSSEVINTGNYDYIRFNGSQANAQYIIYEDDGLDEA